MPYILLPVPLCLAFPKKLKVPLHGSSCSQNCWRLVISVCFVLFPFLNRSVHCGCPVSILPTVYIWCMCLVAQSHLTLCDPMDYNPLGSSVHGDSLGENPGVGCHAFLQGNFPIQGSNPALLYCWWILYCLEPSGTPIFDVWGQIICPLGAEVSWSKQATAPGSGTTTRRPCCRDCYATCSSISWTLDMKSWLDRTVRGVTGL